MADDETVVEAFSTGLRLGRASRVARIGERAVDATAKTEIDRARRDLGHARDMAFRADLRAALGLTEASNDYDIVVAARSAMGLAEARVRESNNLRPDDAPPPATFPSASERAICKIGEIVGLRSVVGFDPGVPPSGFPATVIAEVERLKHQVDEDARVRRDLEHEIGDQRDALAAAARDLAKAQTGTVAWDAVVSAARDLVAAIKGPAKLSRHDAEMALYRAVTALDPAPAPERAP